MKLRLPLYARILGLFLLNVFVIAAAFLIVFRMQFHLGLNSFLAGQANRRVQALSQVVIDELQSSPPAEVDSVLARFSEAFGLDLYVFRTDGQQLGGEPVSLPPQIHRAVRGQGLGRGRGGPAGQRSGFQRPPRLESSRTPPPDAAGSPVLPDAGPEASDARVLDRQPEPPEQWEGLRDGRPGQPGWPEGVQPRFGVPRFFLKSVDPTRYWAGAVFPSRSPTGVVQPAVLLMVSDSITGGGFFFDFTPWVAAGCAGLVLSALIWLPFVRGITRSLGQMSRTAAEISVGRFDARVLAKRSDEIGQLAEAINDMAGRLEGFVTGQRRFLGDVAHELCSPLARIQTALGILEQRGNAKDHPYLADLQEEAQHMSQLVDELLSFSKASLNQARAQRQETFLAEVVAQAVHREQVQGVVVHQNVPADLSAQADPELLQRAIANLLRNAIRYAAQAGPIVITGRREGDRVLLEVVDNGPGVAETSLSRLFDPFYREDQSRARETGGVGLGLTIVKTCVESCGGIVSARNRPEGGLAVQVRLTASPRRPA